MWQDICSLIVVEWHVGYNTITWRHVANDQMVQRANYPMGQRSDGPTVQWANCQRTRGSHIANRWRSDHEICTHHRVIRGRAAGRLNSWLVQPAYVGVSSMNIIPSLCPKMLNVPLLSLVILGITVLKITYEKDPWGRPHKHYFTSILVD